MIAAEAEGTEFRLWIVSAIAVIALHAAGAFVLVRWHEPIIGDDGTTAIVVDLAPFTSPPSESREDIAPGPVQQQSASATQPQPPTAEKEIEEKTEPQSHTPNPDVVLPLKQVKPPDLRKKQEMPPAPETTAPPPLRTSAAQVSSWYRKVAAQVERHKGYPATAGVRHETGVAEVAFTIDRLGAVVESRVAHTSGFAALDQEAIATVKRAQPFPQPPPHLLGATFEFTVPIRFRIR